MGPLALADAGLVRFFASRISIAPWVGFSVGATIVLVTATMSWQRTWIYENGTTLWTDTLRKNPNCWLAHNNLGVALADEGQVGRAIAEYQKALAIKPDYAEADKNLGVVFFRIGDTNQAITQYQKALKIDPNDAEVHNNLGMTFAQARDENDAIKEYQKAIDIQPANAEAHNNLGISLF
jgi:protein O-mannosyl-transferase